MITASIVVYDSPVSQLTEAVECLKRFNIHKIWIIYNGDATKFDNYKHITDVIFIRTDNNGYGAGHNIAINHALEEGSVYHIVMNCDISWEGDIITQLSEYLDRDASVGIIAPEVCYPDGKLQYSCRQLPSPLQLLKRCLLPSYFSQKSDKAYLLKYLDHKCVINAPFLLGCFMMLRMDAIKDVGKFDERFFMYHEDIDLTRRMHRRWKTLYYPYVSIKHRHQRESHRSLRLCIIHFKSMIKYFSKWGWFNDSERTTFNRSISEHSV